MRLSTDHCSKVAGSRLSLGMKQRRELACSARHLFTCQLLREGLASQSRYNDLGSRRIMNGAHKPSLSICQNVSSIYHSFR